MKEGDLLIVCSHTFYEDGKWQGVIYPGQEPYYERHILDGFRLWASGAYDVLIFSGGYCKPELGQKLDLRNSEARGMKEFLEREGFSVNHPKFLLEEYARDTFENIFFSLLCFYRAFGQWPSRTGVITFPFKSARVQSIACGLHINDRVAIPSQPNLRDWKDQERALASDLSLIPISQDRRQLHDPLLRGTEFEEKRIVRTPPELRSGYIESVKVAYDVCFGYDETEWGQGVIGYVIDLIENLPPGPDWRRMVWPWEKQ